jgi:TRAP transporter TAXI family solute receptor
MMRGSGWDIQICYVCAGASRAARLVAGKVVPPPAPDDDVQPMPPQAPLDFGATGTQFIWWAYEGTNAFAKDKEGPRHNLRLIANIEQPSFYMVAVRKGSGISDLRQIRENRMKVKFMQTTIMEDGYKLLDHFNLSEEILEKELNGEFVHTDPKDRDNVDVIAGWVSRAAGGTYDYWMEMSYRYDLEFLQMPNDLMEKWAKEGGYEIRNSPPSLLPGLEGRSIRSIAKSGSVIYGRTDMPDDFAYALAKNIDEHQELLQWTHMNWFYNRHTVAKAYTVPLHPGAAKYYREVGYIK